MSKKALYRIDVAFMQAYSIYSDGESVTSYTDVVWTKGNIQPYKQGLTVESVDAGYRYNDWRVLYIREMPEFDLSNLLPNTEPSRVYVYYEGNWYYIQSDQDWSTQARGVKHRKLLIEKTQPPEGVATPTPFNNLVEDFENAINELEQASTLINEVL